MSVSYWKSPGSSSQFQSDFFHLVHNDKPLMSPPFFFHRNFLRNVSVVIGEYDQRVPDEEEQTFTVNTIKIHEKYQHASPMSYDIALLEINGHIRLGRFPLRYSDGG